MLGNLGLSSLFARERRRPGLAAINIDSDGVALAHIVHGEGRPQVAACVYLPLEQAGGREPALASLAAHHALGQVQCATLLQNQHYKMLLTEAPNVPEDELRGALRWRVKDLVDFDVQEAIVDIFNIPVSNPGTAAKQIYAVIAPRHVVKERVELCERAGVDVEIVDIPEMAQRNLAALMPQDEHGVVMLSMNEHGGLITVTRAGEILLSRTLSIGLGAVAGQQEGLALAYEQLVLETQRSLDFLESHFRQPPVKHLVYGPELADYDKLHQHLQYSLGIEVKALDLASSLDWQTAPPPNLERCLPALGAALRH